MSRKMSNTKISPDTSGANMHQIRWMVNQLVDAVNGIPGAVSLGSKPIKCFSQQELRNRFRQQIALKFQAKYPNA